MLMLCSATAQRSDTTIVWYSPPSYTKDLLVQKKAKTFDHIPTHQDTIEFGERLDIEWFENVNNGLQQALDSFRRTILKGKATSGHLQY